MKEVLKKLHFLLTKRDRQYLIFLLIFSLFISLVETAGIGVIMPYISLASDFSIIHSNEYLHFWYEYSGVGHESTFVILLGVILIVFYLFRSVVNLVYNHLLIRFSQGRYHLLAYRLFQNYMGLPYRDFVKKNSSYLTKTIVSEALNLTGMIQNVLFLISEVFVLILLYAMLLMVNLKITLLLTFLLGLKVIFLKF